MNKSAGGEWTRTMLKKERDGEVEKGISGGFGKRRERKGSKERE